MAPTGLALIIGVTLTAGACRVPGGGGNGGPGPAFCIASGGGDVPDGAPPENATTLALLIGTDDAARARVATPWQDGDHVPLVSGGQGGFMIRPSFDVTAPAALEEDSAQATCLSVTMIAGAPATTPPLMVGALATRIAGTVATYHVPALLGLLSYDQRVDGVRIPLSFYVTGAPGGSETGYAQLAVVPDAALTGP